MIGCGGEGSYMIEHICKKIGQGQISADVLIADNDIVEVSQIESGKKPQNFTIKDVGKNKAKVLAQRFKEYGITAIPKRIERAEQIPDDVTMILLCVDNEKTRDMVIRYCHEKGNKDFIDIRSRGNGFFCMPKTTLEDNLRFVEVKDTKEYSCQSKEDVEKGQIQMGHEIGALVGTQMLLNYLRGRKNEIVDVSI